MHLSSLRTVLALFALLLGSSSSVLGLPEKKRNLRVRNRNLLVEKQRRQLLNCKGSRRNHKWCRDRRAAGVKDSVDDADIPADVIIGDQERNEKTSKSHQDSTELVAKPDKNTNKKKTSKSEEKKEKSKSDSIQISGDQANDANDFDTSNLPSRSRRFSYNRGRDRRFSYNRNGDNDNDNNNNNDAQARRRRKKKLQQQQQQAQAQQQQQQAPDQQQQQQNPNSNLGMKQRLKKMKQDRDQAKALANPQKEAERRRKKKFKDVEDQDKQLTKDLNQVEKEVNKLQKEIDTHEAFYREHGYWRNDMREDWMADTYGQLAAATKDLLNTGVEKAKLSAQKQKMYAAEKDRVKQETKAAKAYFAQNGKFQNKDDPKKLAQSEISAEQRARKAKKELEETARKHQYRQNGLTPPEIKVDKQLTKLDNQVAQRKTWKRELEIERDALKVFHKINGKFPDDDGTRIKQLDSAIAQQKLFLDNERATRDQYKQDRNAKLGKEHADKTVQKMLKDTDKMVRTQAKPEIQKYFALLYHKGTTGTDLKEDYNMGYEDIAKQMVAEDQADAAAAAKKKAAKAQAAAKDQGFV